MKKWTILFLTLACLLAGCSRDYEIIDELPVQQEDVFIPEEVIQDNAPESNEPDRPVAEYVPGTYYGEGKGYQGYITVQVEVDEHFIKSVEITEHSETKSYMNEEMALFIQGIIDNNSLDIDAVSGATATCDGILSAVIAALDQAKA